MKTISGADLIDFWREWPLDENWYADCGSVEDTPDGVALEDPETGLRVAVDPKSKYDLDVIGCITWQGGECPGQVMVCGKTIRTDSKTLSTESVFRAWKRAQTHKTMTVEIPIAAEQELREAVRDLGGRIR